MNDLKTIKKYFKKKRKIIITTHVRPDGDAMGSSLALYHFFKHKGHQPVLIFPTDFPSFFSWLPGSEDIVVWKNDDLKIQELIAESDILIAVDFNQLSRNGELGKYLAEQQLPKILIDHHPEAEDIFQWKLHDTTYCAAAEGIFDFIDYLDSVLLLDNDIATCIYAGLVSDSGSFSYSSVTRKTFITAARLLDSGIDHESIQRNVFNNFSEKRLRFWAHCIAEKMTVVAEAKLAYIVILKDDLKKFDVKAFDTENLVNFAMVLKDIQVSVLVMERDDHIKLSFRSKNDVPVNDVAKRYFNGGGHLNAAGGESYQSVEDTLTLLSEKIKEVVDVSCRVTED